VKKAKKEKAMRLRVCAFVILIFLVIVLFPTLGQSSQQVVVAFSEFPPYKMMVDDRPAGIDVEILKEVAKRMDLALSFKQATFEECMRMMQRGEADLMTSLLRRPEREKYIHYVQPRYQAISVQTFYVRKAHPNLIRSYDDLKNLKIGVKAGVRYAPVFDNDKGLNKIPAPDIETNLRRLVAGEIDTFLDTRTEGDYWIKTFGYGDKITKAPFTFTHSDSIYMGISKKSPLANRAKEFGRHLKDMVDKGNIRMMKEKYIK
jgi:polar amino acid transport system substrate-binding protein